MRVRMAGPMVVLGMLCISGGVSAQNEVLTVQVVSSDQLAELPVSRSLGNLRELVGTVRPAAPLQLNMNNLNIGKGRRVGVNVQRNELVLIEEGTTDQRCEEARRGDQSGWCEEVAVIKWGTSALVGVSSAAGVISVTTHQARPRVRIGAEVTATKFYRAEDVACDQAAIPGLTGCDVESSGVAYGIQAEYRLGDWLSIGAGYTRMKYTVNQDYGSEPIRHEVSVGAFDVFGRLHLRPGARVRPWGIIGWSYYDNADDVYWGDDPYETRGQGGPRILLGGGFDFDIARRVDLRALVRYGGGAERDADSHWGVGAGIGYNF